MSRSGWGEKNFGDPHNTYTVSEISDAVRQHLETEFPDISVIGEIANFTLHSSGHCYFSLRDERNLLRIALFKRYASGIDFEPENGQLVVAAGRLSHYGGSGQTQLIAYGMRIAGRGMMEVEYRRLLGKLMDEGLTAPERKRPVPRYPKRIVVITSPTGAAIRDIADTLGRRWPLAELIHIGVDVQGARAEGTILRAFEEANRLDGVDAVILARGGGSAEDLWIFNSERIARAVASSRHPVITGIGHEVDTTVCDFVSDLRAATPTAAAELATPLREEVGNVLAEYRERLVTLGRSSSLEKLRLLDYLLRSSAFPSIIHRLDRAESSHADLTARLDVWWEKMKGISAGRLDAARMRLERSISQILRAREASMSREIERLPDPGRHIYAGIERIERLVQIVKTDTSSGIALKKRELSERTRTLAGMHPLEVLRRGYTVCTGGDGEGIIARSREVTAGDEMVVHFYDGGALCTVDRKRKGIPWRKKRASRNP